MPRIAHAQSAFQSWRRGKIVAQWTRLIRPPTREFEFTYIHGIKWADVRNEPTFAEVWADLYPELSDVNFLAAHNAPFDRKVLNALLPALRRDPTPTRLRLYCAGGPVGLRRPPDQASRRVPAPEHLTQSPRSRFGRGSLRENSSGRRGQRLAPASSTETSTDVTVSAAGIKEALFSAIKTRFRPLRRDWNRMSRWDRAI